MFQHNGGTLINTGMVTLADGAWFANTNDQSFGPLVLGSGTNSTILLPSGPSTLRFAQCASLPWSNQAILTIEHWNGSVSGGGEHHLRFGTDAAGISLQQLVQIRFHNPGGVSGLFPAAILPNGEIVPSGYLASRSVAGALQLTWGPGTVLQSATSIQGPFQDVTGLLQVPTPLLQLSPSVSSDCGR
jgi:hypothetical protein